MLWAPQFHFPWSGAVAQAIDPDVTWFSQMIKQGAGYARIERRAINLASYGKQLGLITEVLLEQGQRDGAPDSASLRELKAIRARIEDIKSEEYAARAAWELVPAAPAARRA
jgi:hypothetical protein